VACTTSSISGISKCAQIPRRNKGQNVRISNNWRLKRELSSPRLRPPGHKASPGPGPHDHVTSLRGIPDYDKRHILQSCRLALPMHPISQAFKVGTFGIPITLFPLHWPFESFLSGPNPGHPQQTVPNTERVPFLYNHPTTCAPFGAGIGALHEPSHLCVSMHTIEYENTRAGDDYRRSANRNRRLIRNRITTRLPMETASSRPHPGFGSRYHLRLLLGAACSE
jgi:hypothetical protein